jgi:hypothetical protein
VQSRWRFSQLLRGRLLGRKAYLFFFVVLGFAVLNSAHACC